MHLASFAMFANKDQFEALTRHNLSFGIKVSGENGDENSLTSS